MGGKVKISMNVQEFGGLDKLVKGQERFEKRRQSQTPGSESVTESGHNQSTTLKKKSGKQSLNIKDQAEKEQKD